MSKNQLGVQPAVPTDADIDAAMQAFDWDGWIDQDKAKRAFTREALARWAAPAHPAEGVPALTGEALSEVRHAFWREYGRDPIADDVSFAKMVVSAFSTQPAAQGLVQCKPIHPEGMTSINARISFNFGWLACERHHGIRPADVSEALAIDAAQAKQGGAE